MVSIFIPTYNAVKCIGETLGNILNQSYTDIDVWIVDDASTDGTQKLLKEWEKKDSRIHLILKDVNGGNVPHSWNIVFPYLRGEWTLYMSHDDLLSKNCIELLLKHAYEGVDCVIPSCVGFHDNPLKPESDLQEFNKRSNVSRRKVVISGRKAFNLMLNYDIPGFALWKTSLIQKMGMPTESFNSDECMQRLWALNCRHIAFCPEAKFYYRISPNSIVKGLKPYHFGTLLTQRRLILMAVRRGLFTGSVLKYLLTWLKSEIYLRMQYKWMKEDKLSKRELDEIQQILYPWK